MDKFPATFSLHSTEPLRQVTWGFQDIQDLDLLYYSQKWITKEEKYRIDSIITGNKAEINHVLSSYI